MATIVPNTHSGESLCEKCIYGERIEGDKVHRIGNITIKVSGDTTRCKLPVVHNITINNGVMANCSEFKLKGAK